jgi:resuscitation-promoting factor RpfB
VLRMRPYVLALLAFVLSCQQIISQTQPSSQPSANATATGNVKHKPGLVNCTNNGIYVNSKGQTVPRPENCSGAPKGATAQCRDGTYSFSQSRRGKCSHHGGVAKWL